jgi:hypothetical protein
MHKRFRSFIPSFKESRLIFEDPVVPPAPVVSPVTPPVVPPVVPPVDPAKDPNTPEGRISTLAAENKEYKTKLKEFEDAEKKRKDDELTQKGEHQKLAEQYKNESATEKTARETAEAKLKVYEEDAQKRIDDSIKGITDEAKRKSAQDLLTGLSLEEQVKRLPGILALVGPAAAGFGTGTPATQLDQRSVDQKRARYTELLAKGNKTPQEKVETNQLMTELSKVWDAEQAKKAADAEKQAT